MKYVFFGSMLSIAGLFSTLAEEKTNPVEKAQEIPVEYINFTVPLIINPNK